MTELLTGGAAIVCAAAVLCPAFSTRPILRRYPLCSDKIRGAVRIAQISDLHDCAFGREQSKLAGIISGCEPDIILMTGDIIDDSVSADECLTAAHPARQLIDAVRRLAPVYMVMGNHESKLTKSERLGEILSSLGVKLMGGSREQIEIRGSRILLCGADDPYCLRSHTEDTVSEGFIKGMLRRGRELDERRSGGGGIAEWRDALRQAFADVKGREEYTILLSHRPEEYELYRELGFDLAFSGHAHGGQWRLPPLINGVYAPHQGLFPRHAGGLYEYDGFAHIVSRGLSTRRAPRIFNRPELCLAELSGGGGVPPQGGEPPRAGTRMK